MIKRKTIFVIIFFLILLISGLLIYLNNVLLPLKLKVKITQEIEKALGKNVSIESLRFNLFKGLVIRDVAIFDATKDKAYLEVGEVWLNFLIFPLFKGKFIIPSIRLSSPRIYFKVKADNTLNLTDLIPNLKTQNTKSAISFFIYRIKISDGICRFTDERLKPAFNKEITDLNISMRLNLPSAVKFSLRGKILNNKASCSGLYLSGDYGLLAQELNAKLKLINIITDDYLVYLPQPSFSISGNSINSELDIQFKNKQVSVRGSAGAQNFKLKHDKLTLIAGNIDLEPNIIYGLEDKKLSYNAQVLVSEANISGVDFIKDITGVSGNISLEDNKISSDNLKAKLLDTEVAIKASLEDFSSPYLKLKISSAGINLEKILPIIPNMPEDLTLKGIAGIQAEIKGALQKPPFEINADAEISSAEISLASLKEPVKDIKGKINFNNSLKPQIDLTLSSKDLSLKTAFDIKDKIISVKSCTAKYLDSRFNLSGNIDISDNLKPLINIRLSETDIAVKDILGLLPKDTGDNLKKAALAGIISIGGMASGNVKDAKDISADFNLSSASFWLYGLKLDNPRFSLTQENGLLNIPDFTAGFYAGNINLDFVTNLNAEVPLYKANLLASDIELAKLKMDTKAKGKDLSGILNAKANINATLKGMQGATGAGYLQVKDGKLWELNLFQGLGKLLFMPIYEKIIFNDARLDFFLQDEAVQISNAFLGSNEVKLSGDGKIGFDGGLNLSLSAEINEGVLAEVPDIRKYLSFVFGNLLSVEIRGTLQKPEYKINTPAKEIFKQFKQLILPE